MNLHARFRRQADAGPPDFRRPVVGLPRQGLPGFAIAIIASLCAICLFLFLNGQRQRPDETGPLDSFDNGSTAPVPPPLVIPPEILPAPLPAQPIVQLTPRYPIVRQPVVRVQPSYPAMSAPRVVESIPAQVPPPTYYPQSGPPTPTYSEPAFVFGGGASIGQTVQPQLGAGPAPNTSDQGSSGTTGQPARLEQLANPVTTIPTGTLIRATLETPIDTSRPGMARAIVSKDVRGFNGRRILIPRGSRLVGEYASDVRTGQNRVVLNWSQLLRPDGSKIGLGSPAADAMGGAGIPGRVHSYFFQRFLNAVLQTAMNVGSNFAAYSYRSPVIVGIPNTAVTNVVGQEGNALIGQGPQPKITVKQGTIINIFVARDLDFSGASDRSQGGSDGR